MRLVKPSNLEIVLFPGNTDEAIGDDWKLGPHTVCISGYVKDRLNAYYDDDRTYIQEYVVDLDSLVWDTKFLQASTMTSWGEIRSPDSDEVDHSRWGILGVQTGHVDKVIAGDAVRFLRLKAEVSIQGQYNRWEGFGFQTIANGTLNNLSEVFRNWLNKTEEIKGTRYNP